MGPTAGEAEGTMTDEETMMLEGMAKLAEPVGRIQRDEHQTGQPRAQLEEHPLGEVRGPHGQVIPRVEAAEERPRHPLGVVEELTEGPAAARAVVGDSLDQSRAIGNSVRSPAQRLSDGRVEHGLRRIGDDV